MGILRAESLKIEKDNGIATFPFPFVWPLCAVSSDASRQPVQPGQHAHWLPCFHFWPAESFRSMTSESRSLGLW
jgi:hypothetical protein